VARASDFGKALQESCFQHFPFDPPVW